MVLQADFLADGADHSVMFDFELAVNGGEASEDARRMGARQREQRYKTVVCRHWVMGLCMKMEGCEYLHELNPSRMPECRWGEKCQVPDCIFKHTKEEDRIECNFYRIGFCRKGPTCRFRHVRKDAEELPSEVDWDSMGDSRVVTVTEITGADGGVERRTIVHQNENYKVSICKHWVKTGGCPYGDRCHFAHGQDELRSRGASGAAGDPRAEAGPASSLAAPETLLQEIIKGFQQSAEGAPREPLTDAGKDLDTPDKAILERGGPPPAYFVVRTAEQDSVAASLKHGCWSILPCFMERLNRAFDRAPLVVIFFAANKATEFMGCAVMRSPVRVVRDPPFVNLPPEAKGHAFLTDVEWMYTCSLPFATTAFLCSWEEHVMMPIPVAMSFECASLDADAGHALLVMMYRQPRFDVDPATIGDVQLTVHPEGPDPELQQAVDDHAEAFGDFAKENPGFLHRARAAAAAVVRAPVQQQLVGPDGVPVGPGSVQVPNIPGFVVGCSDPEFGREMVDRGILAGPESQRAAMEEIQRGTFMVLFDLREGRLHGIFEATGPIEPHPAPGSFSRDFRNPEAPCELPVQVRVRDAMRARPVGVRQVPSTVLPTDGGEADCFVRIPAPQMQNLANLFARLDGNRAAAAGPQLVAGYPPGVSVADAPPSRQDPLARTVIINVPFKPQFRAAHRIIGKGGANIKRIQAAGVRCSVKPLDQGTPAAPGEQQDINGPMQIVFFGNDPESMVEAEKVALIMAEDLARKYDEFIAFDGPPRGGPRDGPRGGPRDDFRRGGPPRGGRHRDDMSVASSDRGGGGGGPRGRFPRDRSPPRGRRPDRDFDRRGGRDRSRDRSPARFRDDRRGGGGRRDRSPPRSRGRR